MMATCKDCIHYDICKFADNTEYADTEHLKGDCPHFKNIADFAEVTLCGNCKHFEYPMLCHLRKVTVLVARTDFCSYGERNESQ
jgi:hypothetical protein